MRIVASTMEISVSTRVKPPWRISYQTADVYDVTACEGPLAPDGTTDTSTRANTGVRDVIVTVRSKDQP